MEANSNPGTAAKSGTIGGTLLVLLLNITSEEVLKTAVLAAVGAVVSFFISYLLKRIVEKRKAKQ